MYTSARNRAASALASLLIVAGGLAAMMAGLAARMTPQERRETLAAIIPLREEPEKPRPKEIPAKADSTAAKGRPSPPNLRNKATQVVAPPPKLPPLIVPPPIVTAPKAGIGSAAQSGASDRLGPGQGAGGIGDGDGGGGNGDGAGEGDDDALTRPRQIRGRLHFSDLPPDLREAKSGGELKLQYRIGVDGRVSDCRILTSSGRPDLDATTCRLITERFRFKPSRNRAGEPVAAIMVETHGWYFPPEDTP
ncbi:TonB family protein [Novosphingobium resinovorum]|uniref:TonB-like protein n=1 Tax=Novosphingobium resinovorum TaxID=158500 RepID=A0A031JTS9_9SPHN|nr:MULTISPECIES: TonB family protein [Sphingomonadaceae]EJU12461.1 TonB-like protein [Sphingomonas sp. LH128]EZP80320.1 TonB-like protein [Novosphingobium resinovorum]MBF7012354.1 TonB family protein [Novosphingobium sp. HR1a]WJM27095.1 TonB family protein [Novosphingobium resinovorum]